MIDERTIRPEERLANCSERAPYGRWLGAEPDGEGTPRALGALDSVERLLGTPHGLVLQYPAYTTYQVQLGEVSTYPPGYKGDPERRCAST